MIVMREREMRIGMGRIVRNIFVNGKLWAQFLHQHQLGLILQELRESDPSLTSTTDPVTGDITIEMSWDPWTGLRIPTCQHEWVNVGFMSMHLVCKFCNVEKY